MRYFYDLEFLERPGRIDLTVNHCEQLPDR